MNSVRNWQISEDQNFYNVLISVTKICVTKTSPKYMLVIVNSTLILNVEKQIKIAPLCLPQLSYNKHISKHSKKF